jgi:hypothetical protein
MKIHRQIDSKVSVLMELPATGGKNRPRVPNPPKYSRLPDTEGFERWLSTLLCWLKVNKVCGPDLDSDRIEYTAMFLENTALTWFEDSVDGAYHQRSVWTFKEVITGLYDWFVHENATHDVTDKFWHVDYNAKEGVMSYYHKLERYTTTMIQAPDPFTFKTQLVTGLPNNIIFFVLDKGCSTETSSVGDILHYACQAEEIGKMRKCFNEKKRIMDSMKSKTSSSTKTPKTKDLSPERSYKRLKDRSYKHDKKYRDNSKASSPKYPDKER